MKEAIVESKEAKYPVWVKGNFTMESGTMTGTAGYYDLPEIPTRDNVAHSIRVDNEIKVGKFSGKDTSIYCNCIY